MFDYHLSDLLKFTNCMFYDLYMFMLNNNTVGVIIKSLKARIQTMSFPTYINFQVNNIGEGRSNMVVHSHAVILMLLSLFPESFVIFKSIYWLNVLHFFYHFLLGRGGWGDNFPN